MEANKTPDQDHVDQPAPNIASEPKAAEEELPRPRGGQKGNRNAARPGQDLRVEFYLSKTRAGFLAEWFNMVYGRPPENEEELRGIVRLVAYEALDRMIIEEFERQQPGRVFGSRGEVF